MASPSPEMCPHVVVLSFPIQGHIKPMMHLSKVLASTGFTVTFVNTEFVISSLIESQHFSPKDEGLDIRVVGISDGLPPHFRAQNSYMVQRILAFEQNMVSPFSDLLARLMDKEQKVSYIIYDVLMSWAQIVATKFGIPATALWTSGASCYVAYSEILLLISQGLLPVKGGSAALEQEDLITSIPGLRPVFRVKDLPSFLLVDNIDTDDIFQFILRRMSALREAKRVLLNTTHELDSEVEDAMRASTQHPPVTPIGPLFAFDPQRGNREKNSTAANLWREDNRCVEFLKGKRPGSVLYVSFGSTAVLSERQAEEFAKGLEESKQPFVWACRAGLVDGSETWRKVRGEFEERTKGQGMVVDWVAQEEVLRHESVGGFLTHCGWNSILEAMWAGKPMLGWPLFAEQRMNCRMMEDVWRVGLELKPHPFVTSHQVASSVIRLMSRHNGTSPCRQCEHVQRTLHGAVDAHGSSRRNLDAFTLDLLTSVRA